MLFNVDDTVHKLQSYTNSSYSILSVYLSIPENNSRRILHQQFHKLIQTNLDISEKESLTEDLSYMDAFLAQYENSNGYRGIALFSGGNNLWEIVTTEYPLPNSVYVEHSPYLKPLMKEMETYNCYLVVVVDRKKARFFTLFLDTLEEEIQIKDPSVPQNVKGRNAGERADKVARHILYHLHRHFQLVVEEMENFIRDKSIQGVIIGSHKEIIHKLEKALPNYLRDEVIGEFHAEPDDDLNLITEKSKSIVHTKPKKKFVKHHQAHYSSP